MIAARAPVISRTGLVAVVVSLIYTFSYYPSPNPFDEFLALPIAHAIADPGLYSPNDLLVTSGARAPFLVYHAAAWLYRAGFDVDLVWYFALVVSLAATFSAIYYLTRAFVGPIPAAVATVLVACSDPQLGTMNWSWMPQRSFVSATLALPMVFFAIGLAARKRPATGLMLAALASWVHPGFGLIGFVTCSALALFDAAPSGTRQRFGQALPAILVMAASAWYVRSAVPSNFTADAMTPAEFDRQFRLFAWHAFVEDHWRDGYLFFALQLGFVTFALRTFAPAARRTALLILGSLYAMAAAWIAFVYVGGSPMLTLTFLVRATALAKPLCWALIAGWAAVQVRDASGNPILPRLLVSLLCIAALLPSIPWATALASVATIGLVTSALRAPTPAIVSRGVEARSDVRLALRLSAAVLVAAVLLLTRDFHGWVPARPTRIWRRLHFSRPAGDLAGVERWARTESPRGALFVVPPGDDRFVPFRLRAERGVYAHHTDVNQLAYDLSAYPLVRERLEREGVTIVRRHDIDAGGYERLTPAAVRALAADGVAFGIFARDRAPSGLPEVYADSAWVVVSLASSAK